jgi:hypothetical protein
MYPNATRVDILLTVIGKAEIKSPPWPKGEASFPVNRLGNPILTSQLPDLQRLPVGHFSVQPPQWDASDDRFKQVWLHKSGADCIGQDSPHAPLLQVADPFTGTLQVVDEAW